MEFDELTDSQLHEKLTNGTEVEQMLLSNGWKVVLEAMKRVKKSQENSLRHIDPFKNPGDVVKAQNMIEVLDNFIPSLINGIRQDGFIAFSTLQAKDEDLV